MLRLGENDCPNAEAAVIAACALWTGCSPLFAEPTIWCVCAISPPQVRRCKSGPTCVLTSSESDSKSTKTTETEHLDLISDENTKEKHAANQFFSSLLDFNSGLPSKLVSRSSDNELTLKRKVANT